MTAGIIGWDGKVCARAMHMSFYAASQLSRTRTCLSNKVIAFCSVIVVCSGHFSQRPSFALAIFCWESRHISYPSTGYENKLRVSLILADNHICGWLLPQSTISAKDNQNGQGMSQSKQKTHLTGST